MVEDGRVIIHEEGQLPRNALTSVFLSVACAIHKTPNEYYIPRISWRYTMVIVKILVMTVMYITSVRKGAVIDTRECRII